MGYYADFDGPEELEQDDPVIFECDDCGSELCPMHRDITCECGSSYNAFGQKLARLDWNEGNDY